MLEDCKTNSDFTLSAFARFQVLFKCLKTDRVTREEGYMRIEKYVRSF